MNKAKGTEETSGKDTEAVVMPIKKDTKRLTPDESFLLCRRMEAGLRDKGAKVKDLRILDSFCKNIQKQMPKYEGEFDENGQPKDVADYQKFNSEKHDVNIPAADFKYARLKLQTHPSLPQGNGVRHVSMGIFKEFGMIKEDDDCEKAELKCVIDRGQITMLYNLLGQKIERVNVGYAKVIETDRLVELLLKISTPAEGAKPQLEDKLDMIMTNSDFKLFQELIGTESVPVDEQSRSTVLALADAFEVK